jgi:hypothetical protein
LVRVRQAEQKLELGPWKTSPNPAEDIRHDTGRDTLSALFFLTHGFLPEKWGNQSGFSMKFRLGMLVISMKVMVFWDCAGDSLDLPRVLFKSEASEPAHQQRVPGWTSRSLRR